VKTRSGIKTALVAAALGIASLAPGGAEPTVAPRAPKAENVIWEPIPGSSQELALDTRCQITLYTGARGPGKTDTQLMRFRRNVGKGYGQFWQGIIFDKEYKNLADLITKSKRWFNAFNDGAKFHEGTNALYWEWPTGERLYFRVAKKEADYWNYHGHEYPFVGWNELTKYADAKLFDMMMSVNRSSYRPEDYPIWIDGLLFDTTGEIVFVDKTAKSARKHLIAPIPLEVFATCNPYGVGHGWVKKRFINKAPYGVVVYEDVEIFSAQTQTKKTVRVSQVAIFGSYAENPYLDDKYIATLFNEKNVNRRKAWLTGSWNIVAGGAFDDVWDEAYNIVPTFPVPKDWRIDRCFDWGSSHPFAVEWVAEANGEEVMLPDGRTFCPPPKSLIVCGEWYGSDESNDQSNVGLKISAKAIAVGIRDREIEWMNSGHMQTQPRPGPADNQIRDVTQVDVETIEKKMSDEGVRWTPSDKSQGSRKNGMQLVRDMLDNARTREGPGLFFMRHCRYAIDTIPILPRDEVKIDDVDTDAEDHCYDAIRYRVLAGSNRYATKIPVTIVY
jgi:hypothetical protein